MLTRIGDLGQATRLKDSMLATQSRMRQAELAVATGKAASGFDQIADRAGLLVRTKDVRQLTATFLEQNARAIDRMTAMDAAIGRLGDIVERARALLVQRLDSATGDSVPLDIEVEGMLAEVETQLNTRFDGRYLLAGSRADAMPVSLPDPPPTVADPALYYAGDEVTLSVRADRDVDIDPGITAADPAFAELIAALGIAHEGHGRDDGAALRTALARLDAVVGGLAEMRGGLNARTARIEALAEGQRATVTYLDAVISDIEDADLPDVLTRLARDRASLEASYLTTGRLASLSLADYLR